MVIVTKNQYILCKKIHDVILDDGIEVIESRNGRGWSSHHFRMHQITIRYEPDNGNPHGSNVMEATIKLYNKSESRAIYADLIQQIREQNPDQVYLDKALESLLGAGTDIKTNYRDKYDDFTLEPINVTGTKKTSRPRKTKRRGKKVLRKTKRSRK